MDPTATVTISDGTTPGGTYPVKDPVDVQTEKAEPSMLVIKTSDSDKKTVKAGDTINYTIRVINNGNARVTIDENGNPQLVSASDAETPLMNLNLGDHACNVLRFLILLAAMAMVIVHTKKMKQYQSRIFELREKLEEAKGRK